VPDCTDGGFVPVRAQHDGSAASRVRFAQISVVPSDDATNRRSFDHESGRLWIVRHTFVTNGRSVSAAPEGQTLGGASTPAAPTKRARLRSGRSSATRSTPASQNTLSTRRTPLRRSNTGSIRPTSRSPRRDRQHVVAVHLRKDSKSDTSLVPFRYRDLT